MEQIEPDKELSEEYLRQSMSRTKRVIFEYALCNEFEYFITLTFDRKKYDSTNLKLLKAQVGQWLNNYKFNKFTFKSIMLIIKLFNHTRTT